jgi:D-alanine--poly(phosphoribitol) ligase subunit 2
MKFTKDEVLKIIFQVIDEDNETRAQYEQIAKSVDTAFLSKDGVLDSMGLVNFIVSTEERIAECTGKNITIADARAMSQKHSPFRTIGSLADYIVELLNDSK